MQRQRVSRKSIRNRMSYLNGTEKSCKAEIPMLTASLERVNFPRLLKTLKADYKKELIGERLITTPSITRILKLPKVATDLVPFVPFR